MRVIKDLANIRELVKYEIINSEFGKRLYNLLQGTVNVIILTENGDRLRYLGVYGIEDKTGGIIGTIPINIRKVDGFIFYYYQYGKDTVCLILKDENLTKEARGYLQIYNNSFK